MNSKNKNGTPVTIVFVLLLILLMVTLTMQNMDKLELTILFWKIREVPLFFALVISLVMGFLIAFIYFYPKLWKQNSEIKALTRQLNKLDPERRTDITDDDFEITDKSS